MAFMERVKVRPCQASMGCQAELGVSSWVLAGGKPASPAQPQAALPQVDELACQCDGAGGAGFYLASIFLQLDS